MTTYRIHDINGRFDHVSGKSAAIARANEMARWIGEPLLTEDELRVLYGITIQRVSADIARSVGFQK